MTLDEKCMDNERRADRLAWVLFGVLTIIFCIGVA